MSNPTEKGLGELAEDIRQLLEETVDLIQETKRVKAELPFAVRNRASSHITERVQAPSVEIMNQYEMASIRSLLAWAANEQHAPPETIKAVTEVHFGVDDVSNLPRKSYDEVIKFLIDLRIDEMKN